MINLLIRTLKEHDDAYYNGQAEISDDEYDALKEKARAMKSNHPYFDGVGAPYSGEKVALPFVLGSLNKVKSDTVEKWLDKHPGPYCVTEKLDGVSFMVTYKDGEVVFAATRGDGSHGRNITDKAKIFCPSLSTKRNFSFRCEAMLVGDTYKRLGFKTRRNGVAGILNKDGITNANHIVPYFYEILDGTDADSEINKIALMDTLGLSVPRYFSLMTPKDSVETLTDFLLMCKNDDKDIDGLVITPDKYVREDVLYPESKVAFKVNEEAIDCEIVDIEWNTSRTGRIVPVIIIKPTVIQGVTVERVTGHNAKYIQENDVAIGAIIGVVRSGDVIPYIMSVKKKSKYSTVVPEQCPTCRDRAVPKGVDMVCNNQGCGAKAYKMVEHFLVRLGAEYITEKTLRKLNIDTIKKAYEIDEFEIAGIEGFGMKRGEQIVSEVQKTLRTLPNKLISAFGMPNVGRTVGKIICDAYSGNFPGMCSKEMMTKFFSDTESSFESMDGIGEIIAENIVIHRDKFWDLYTFLLEQGLKFESGQKLQGKKFTLTGKGSMSRPAIQKKIENLGGTVKGISKDVDMLVTGDPDSQSGKAKKARKYGIEVVSYEKLMEILDG